MSTSSDSAEQLIRLYLDGAEFALKITGSATKNIVAALYAMSKDKKASKGRTRLANMLKSDKELKIFSLNKEDMKVFASQAKIYGILYCALVNKKNKDFDGMVDILVRAEDAPKVDRIIERFNLDTVDRAKIIKDEIEKEMENSVDGKDVSENSPDKGVQEKDIDDKMIDDIFSAPTQKEEQQVPLVNQTTKDNLSENSLEEKTLLSDGTIPQTTDRPSVRKKINELKKEEAKEQKQKKELEVSKGVKNETIIPEINAKPKKEKVK